MYVNKTNVNMQNRIFKNFSALNYKMSEKWRIS